MGPSRPPKVLLFDLGGVCVVSPFQAIQDYEDSLHIPRGWVNYSISKSAPNGAWHKLERGDILMDDAFFSGFNADLHNPDRWAAFHAQLRQKQKQQKPHLTSASVTAGSGDVEVTAEIPPLPKVDGEALFWEMMRISRALDPWMAPALFKLRASGRFILAALSNTVIFPPEHAYNERPLGSNVFDVFVSSAHVGMRKPEPRIYQLALEECNAFAKANASTKGKGLGWENGIKAEEIVFLDDIGENLKAAKKAGFGTIKVHLGRAYEAVAALEELTGLKLAGDHPIPVDTKAKL